jgi:hypothetical protein
MSNYYSEVMDKVYYHILKTYIAETSKLVEEKLTKHDMIIQEEQKQKSGTGHQ